MGLCLFIVSSIHVANANRNEKWGLTLERNRNNSCNNLVESHTPSNEGFIQPNSGTPSLSLTLFFFFLLLKGELNEASSFPFPKVAMPTVQNEIAIVIKAANSLT